MIRLRILSLALFLVACQTSPAEPLPSVAPANPTATQSQPDISAVDDQGATALDGDDATTSAQEAPAQEQEAVAQKTEAEATPAATVSPTAALQRPTSPPDEAPSVSVINPTPVTIIADDGLTIAGTYYVAAAPGPRPAVILLHQLGSRRTIWDEGQTALAPQLAAAGYDVLTIDMRGHGETGGTQDWPKAADDLQRAWEFLAASDGVDAARTAIIGASIGSNMALIGAAGRPAVATAILLSPGLDYRGVTTAEAIITYGQRPLLIVASEEDSYAATSAAELVTLAPGESRLILYQGAGHGTAMFGPEPELTTEILAWLSEHMP